MVKVSGKCMWWESVDNVCNVRLGKINGDEYEEI